MRAGRRAGRVRLGPVRRPRGRPAGGRAMSDRPRAEDVPQPEPPEEPHEADPVEPVPVDQGSGLPIAPPQVPPDPGAPPAPAEPPPSPVAPEPERRGPDMLAPGEAAHDDARDASANGRPVPEGA